MKDKHPPLNYRRELRKLIVKYFDKEKLRTMCFDLGVNFDDLRGDGIENNVISLISHFIKFGRLHELINYCKDELPEAINQFTVIQEIIEADPTVLLEAAALRAKDESTQSASTGLYSLVKLAAAPKVRNAIIEYQIDFKSAVAQIESVKHYKLLHDLFQDMELNYDIVHEDRMQNPEGKAAWNSMMINGLLLNGAINNLLEVAAQSSGFYAEHQLVLLRNGQDILRKSIEEEDLSQLDAALHFLYQSLRQGLALANRRLVDTARELRLHNLVKVLNEVKERLEHQQGINSDEFTQFSSSISDLIEVDDRLKVLVTNHNLWQDFYDELRYVEENIGRDDTLIELKLTWSGLKQTAHVLFGKNDAIWADLLRKAGMQLDDALAGGNSDEIERLFHVYFNRATRRFRIVDDELLVYCQDLRRIGEPLESLLKIIDG